MYYIITVYYINILIYYIYIYIIYYIKNLSKKLTHMLPKT